MSVEHQWRCERGESVQWRAFSSKGTSVELPEVMRMKDLAKKLKLKLERASSLYRLHEDSLPFKHQKDVIIPFYIAKDIAEKLGRTVTYREVDRLPLESGRTPFSSSFTGVDSFLASLPASDDTQSSESEVTAMVKRPAIVTVMGHVDHGKTTLLDLLRSIAHHRRPPVAPQEVGLITQRVTAFNLVGVPPREESFTFLDTPGHAAFTRMRDSGCIAADMVLLVIAADEGIREQTRESLEIAHDWELPLVVALNKIDLLDSREAVEELRCSVEKELKSFASKLHAVIPISATGRTNIDALLDALHDRSSTLPLMAPATCEAEGYMVESSLTSKGKAINVILKRGTLSVNDYFVVGDSYAKCRDVLDHGLQKTHIGPGEYGEVLGFKGRLPATGENFLGVSSRAEGIEVAEHRMLKLAFQELMQERIAENATDVSEVSLAENDSEGGEVVEEQEIGDISEGMTQFEGMRDDDVYIVLKADNRGSLETFLDAIDGMNEATLEAARDGSSRRKLVHVIHSGVGRIDVSDVRTSTAHAVPILAFNAPEDPTVKRILGGGRAQEQLVRKNKIKGLDKLQVFHFNIYQDLLDCLERSLADEPSEEPEDVEGVAPANE